MPTRLVVLLQRRKSASARVGVRVAVVAASKPPSRTPTERLRDLSIMVRRSFIVPQWPDRRPESHVKAHGLSTKIARKSLTLVWVGPGTRRSFSVPKNSDELLS